MGGEERKEGKRKQCGGVAVREYIETQRQFKTSNTARLGRRSERQRMREDEEEEEGKEKEEEEEETQVVEGKQRREEKDPHEARSYLSYVLKKM